MQIRTPKPNSFIVFELMTTTFHCSQSRGEVSQPIFNQRLRKTLGLAALKTKGRIICLSQSCTMNTLDNSHKNLCEMDVVPVLVGLFVRLQSGIFDFKTVPSPFIFYNCVPIPCVMPTSPLHPRRGCVMSTKVCFPAYSSIGMLLW